MNKKRSFKTYLSWLDLSKLVSKTSFYFTMAIAIAITPVLSPLVIFAQEDPEAQKEIAVEIKEPAVVEPIVEEDVIEKVEVDKSEPESTEPTGVSHSEKPVSCSPPPPNPEVPCGENAIINGSFEAPIVTTPQKWDVYSSGATDLGWRVEWAPSVPDSYQGTNKPYPAKLELLAGYSDWNAQSGNQYAELDGDWDGPSGSLGGEPASVEIYQDLTTTAGKTYNISFHFSPRPGTDASNNTLEFSWDGDVIDTISQAGGSDVNWTNYTYSLEATSDITRIQFADRGTSDSLGTFLDNVVVYEVCNLTCEDLEGQSGWYGEYFNYSASHPDMDLPDFEWPDKTHGDPLGSWTTDWYDSDYYRFNKLDANLEFGEDFFPFDVIPEETHNGHDYHFGAHWSAKITVPAPGDYNYALTSDDDVWIYIDGILIADNSGIHPPVTITDLASLTDEHIVDIFFAERHVVRSHMFFAFENPDILIEPYWDICEEPPMCIPGDQWADNVMDVDQGDTKGGGSVSPDRSDPESALNEPDGVFFSLGQGGSLTVSFNHYILDVDGDDLSFHETTYGRYSYPEETITVEVSQDSLTWFEVGSVSNHAPADGVGYIDFNSTGLSWIQYVRITDTTDYDLHADGADGYDIDAIGATYGSCNYGTLDKTGVYDYETGHITYTIIGSLYGEGMAYDIVITDELPEGTEFVSANYSGTEILGVVTWNMGDIMAPAMGVFKLEVVVSPLAGTDPWVDTVVSFSQGLTQDGSPVLAERSDPTQALGEAERTDVVNFVSLGFGGEIILEFNEPIFNGAGDDIEIVETSYGNPDESAYPETIKVYASQNGTDWTFLADAILDEMVDLGPLYWAKYIKLVDTSDPIDFSGSADGFDVDGIRGVYPVPNICEIENTVYGEYQTEDDGEGETIWDSATTMTLINPLVCEEPGEDGYAAGMKFNDHDGNGQKDTEDEGLEGWTIFAGRLIEELGVDSNGPETGTPITSATTLTTGQKYFIRASSTFYAGDSITADAKYSVQEPNTEWTDIVQSYESWGATLLDLHIDDIALDWGEYNENHVYWLTVMGTDAQLTFQIYDIYASNNEGVLSVEIYEVVTEDITDIDGNYYLGLDGINGDVVIAEQTQAGWIQTAPSPNGFYVVSANDESEGLDFGNRFIEEDKDDDDNGGGGGSGGGYSYTPPGDDEEEGDDEEVAGEQDENNEEDNNNDGAGGGNDEAVLGEQEGEGLAAAGPNTLLMLILAILMGLLFTSAVYPTKEIE